MLADGRRLGDVLISKKIITDEQLAKALSSQRNNPNKKLGEIIAELGYASELAIIKVASKDYHIPMAIELLKRQGRDVSHLTVDGLGLHPPRDDSYLENIRSKFTVPSIIDERLQTIDPAEETILETIISLIDSKKYSQAINYGLDSICKFPSSDPLIYLLTWLYAMEGFEVDALTINKQMNPKYKKDIYILELLAYAHLVSEDYQGALNAYRVILKSDEAKNNLDWYFYFGYASDRFNQSMLAIKFYKHYLKNISEENPFSSFIRKRLKDLN